MTVLARYTPPPAAPLPIQRVVRIVLAAALLSVAGLAGLTGLTPPPLVLGGWISPSAVAPPAPAVNPAPSAGDPTCVALPNDAAPALVGPPTIRAQEIDAVLAAYGSPATGSGQAFYDAGVRHCINPAFALAFFIHESSAGTNPAWAGWKTDQRTTHNVGNIICAGYDTCYGRFRDYPSWNDGIEDWYRLLDVEYIHGRGTTTVATIIPIYAPAFENDVDHYVNSVNALVTGWLTS